MNEHEERLFNNIKIELKQLKAEVTQVLGQVIEAEADVDWHFDQYNEAVGNSEISPKEVK